MSFSDRLNLLIKELGVSKNEFATKLGYKNNGVLYDYTKKGDEATKPGLEFFEKLVHAKTGVNLEWLIGGKGDMMIKKGTAATSSSEAAVLADLEALRELVLSQQRTIEILSSKV